MRDRVPYLAKSYFKNIDNVVVFSDVLNPDDIANVKDLALPCNVSAIKIDDTAEYLSGTADDTTWTRPQG